MEEQNQNLPEQTAAEQKPVETPVVKNEKTAGKSHFLKFFVLGFLFVIVAGLIAVAFFLGRNSVLKQINPTSPAMPSPGPDFYKGSPAPTTKEEKDTFRELGDNVIMYSSPTLGISFNYVTPEGQQKLYVTRNGNKVCVGTKQNDLDCTQGQSVKIFKKDSSQSLTQAIETQFLNGIDKTDCFVKLSGSKATISYPHDTNSDLPWFDSPAAQKCPAQYSETNGIRYFYSDNSAPDKFAFFDIGQYPIMGSNDEKTTWQDTFKFTQ